MGDLEILVRQDFEMPEFFMPQLLMKELREFEAIFTTNHHHMPPLHIICFFQKIKNCPSSYPIVGLVYVFYSVTQSLCNSSLGDVVLDGFNMVYGDGGSI